MIAGKYLLVEPLGAGGMGQVWTAQNMATNAEVAVKLLLASRLHCAGVVERFRSEAHATAQLAHRGIIRIFDLVELGEGSLAMVMERLHGRTLAEHLEHHGPLSVDETLAIVMPVLAALHHAHGVGIVHRDLKPENIFLALEPDGEMIPKLLDFGVSKMLRSAQRPVTGDGLVVGTPGHMSPEQVRGEEVDSRSDIFCVGILLCMCLTGQNPYAADSEDCLAVMRKVFDVVPQRPSHVAAPLWQVILRSLAQNADDRFPTAHDLAVALSQSQRVSHPDYEEDGTAPGYARPKTLVTLEAVGPHGVSRKFGALAAAAALALLSLAAMRGPSSAHAAAAARAHYDVPTRVAHAERRVLVAHDLVAPGDPQPDSTPPVAVAAAAHAHPDVQQGLTSFIASARSIAHAREAKAKVVLRDPGF